MKVAPRMPSRIHPLLSQGLIALACVALGASSPAWAQAEADGKTKSDAAANLERAQKQADQVFHWIKLNAAVERKPAPAPAPAPAPVQVVKRAPAAAARPATAVAGNAEAPTLAAVVASAPAPAPLAQAPASEPALESPIVVASLGRPGPAPDAALSAAVEAAKAPPAPEPREEEAPIRLLERVDPEIPRLMRSTSFTGFAQVRFTIAPNGTVSDASAIKASHTKLGIAAVEAIKQWRFAAIPKAREVAIQLDFNNE